MSVMRNEDEPCAQVEPTQVYSGGKIIGQIAVRVQDAYWCGFNAPMINGNTVTLVGHGRCLAQYPNACLVP